MLSCCPVALPLSCPHWLFPVASMLGLIGAALWYFSLVYTVVKLVPTCLRASVQTPTRLTASDFYTECTIEVRNLSCIESFKPVSLSASLLIIVKSVLCCTCDPTPTVMSWCPSVQLYTTAMCGIGWHVKSTETNTLLRGCYLLIGFNQQLFPANTPY